MPTTYTHETRHARVIICATLALSACNRPLVGQEHCPTELDEYEATYRAPVSALTGVDTSVAGERPYPGPYCCLDDFLLNQSSDGIAVPKDAARYPWLGHTEPRGMREFSCNTCPYGIASIQGVWGDTNHGMPLTVDEFESPTLNRIEIDGNTFRWRAKDRRTGEWFDFRGYYFCDEDGRQFLVPLSNVRGEGVPCPGEKPSAAVLDLPAVEVGVAIQVAMNGAFTSTNATEVRALAVVASPSFWDGENAFYCRPGETIGVLNPEYRGFYDATCPSSEQFFDCWDPDPKPTHE